MDRSSPAAARSARAARAARLAATSPLPATAAPCTDSVSGPAPRGRPQPTTRLKRRRAVGAGHAAAGAGAKVLLVGTELMPTIEAIRDRLTTVEHVIEVTPEGGEGDA